MRETIKLNLQEENFSKTDEQLDIAFKSIAQRAQDGTIDDEDVAFVKARRDYLTDTYLKNVTGMTYEEIENEVSNPVSNKEKADLTKKEIVAKLKEHNVTFKENEDKESLLKILEEIENDIDGK